jgi:hypothetical protein
MSTTFMPKGKPESKPAKVTWTTGDIAKLLDVSPKTVAGWMDEGDLFAVTMPGMTERRAHRGALRSFCRTKGLYWAVAYLDLEEGRITPEEYDVLLDRGPDVPMSDPEIPVVKDEPKAKKPGPKKTK